METDNPFEKVLDRLREKGWMKDKWGPPEGPNCILGGLEYSISLGEWRSTRPYLDVLAIEHYPDRVQWDCGVPAIDFNNHPDTTFADVERVLEKAAVKWEEERVMRDEG